MEVDNGSILSEFQKQYEENLMNQTGISTVYPSIKTISPEDLELLNEISRKEKNLNINEKIIYEFFSNNLKKVKEKRKMKIRISNKFNALKKEGYIDLITICIKSIFDAIKCFLNESMANNRNKANNIKQIIYENNYESPLFNEYIKRKEKEDCHHQFFEKIENFANEN